MMYDIPLDPVVSQAQSFSLLGHNLNIKTDFNVTTGGMSIDVFDIDTDDYVVTNYGLAVGCPSLVELNLDYVFVLVDNSPLGTQPMSAEAIGNRITLVMVDKDEWFQTIRSVVRTEDRK